MNSITSSKIASNAVTAAKITAGTVTKHRVVEGDDGNFRVEYLQEPPGHDRLEVLEALRREVKRGEEAEWWLAVRQAWQDEWRHRHLETRDALNRWIAMFTCDLPGRDALLHESDRPFWDAQPDLLTVYRGCGGRLRNNQRTLGLSWTLDRGVAESYAAACRGPGNVPGVWEASLLKSDAIAYFGRRFEFEVITPPWRVSCARWTPLAS